MAGSLFGGVSKESLVCETVKELIKATGSELDLLLPYYRSRSLILGKEITFINDGVSQKGTAIDIDGSGGLVIFTDGGTVTLNSSFSILDY